MSNENRIILSGFSNPAFERLYSGQWADDPKLWQQNQLGEQCGGCSFFAKLNLDLGICCHTRSRHFTETVFEHFTCPAYVHEGWGPHSFTEDTEFHCRCSGDEIDTEPN
jgi:hypothetical protein